MITILFLFMVVIPLSQPLINWEEYLRIGRNLTRSLDNTNLDPRSLAAYIVTLAELKGCQGPILENPGHLLDHLYFSFLIETDHKTVAALMEETNLSILHNESLVVATGSLTQWRNSIINCCSPVSAFSTRLLMDKCLLHFEKAGLGKIFSAYRKVQLLDNTFQLEMKR